MRTTSLVLTFFIILSLAGCKGFSPDSITVLSREEGSGTRSAFEQLTGIPETTPLAEISDSTAVMITSVAGNRNAIGYISLGSMSDKVKALKINGTDISAKNIKNGTYKLSRAFYIATKKAISPAAQDFIKFILSEQGQKIVEENKYISVHSKGSYTSLNIKGSLKIAGSSSVTPVMEKIKEAYNTLNPNVKIELQQSDSSNAVTGTLNGICDIGMLSRELKESELSKGLTATEIALDGIAVIVNKENPLDNISLYQLKKIYTNETANWGEISN